MDLIKNDVLLQKLCANCSEVRKFRTKSRICSLRNAKLHRWIKMRPAVCGFATTANNESAAAAAVAISAGISAVAVCAAVDHRILG